MDEKIPEREKCERRTVKIWREALKQKKDKEKRTNTTRHRSRHRAQRKICG